MPWQRICIGFLSALITGRRLLFRRVNEVRVQPERRFRRDNSLEGIVRYKQKTCIFAYNISHALLKLCGIPAQRSLANNQWYIIYNYLIAELDVRILLGPSTYPINTNVRLKAHLPIIAAHYRTLKKRGFRSVILPVYRSLGAYAHSGSRSDIEKVPAYSVSGYEIIELFDHGAILSRLFDRTDRKLAGIQVSGG